MWSTFFSALLSSSSHILNRAIKSGVRLSRAGIRRKLVCFAIIANLLIWPSPEVTFRPVFEPMSVLASDATSTVLSVSSAIASSVSELRALPVVMIPAGPVMVPVPWPFAVGAPRELSMVERTARVSSILVAPHKYVGYTGDSVTFVATGTDALGQPAHGAKFTWESSDERKLTIDEAGRASLLSAGTVIVTGRAGVAVKAAPVLIRSTRRRVQTDAEWRADQESLVASAGSQSGIGSMLASLGDRLMPTAHAQGGQGTDYGNAAQTIGTPPFAALEETRLGPVMPQTNFELPLSLVDLGGRGLGTSLMAYYNSNPWGAYVDGSFATHYVFDPIQSWPSPGFSLGFGRIVIYDYSYYDGIGFGYKYMWVRSEKRRNLSMSR